jgi:large subunit ribosomal protein L25
MGHSFQTVVPVTFVGSSEGERAGGTLMHSTRELRIEANPKDLPEHIQVDVSALEIGDSLTVADLAAPNPETVLVSVVAPMGEEEEPEAEFGEVAEVPEVGEEAAEAEETEE